MGFVKQRKVSKCGLSATVSLEVFVKLNDIAVTRRAKLSPIVDEILQLGIQKYEELKFAEDLKSVKEDEILRRRVFTAEAKQ